MRRDPRLIEQAFKGGRCRLACSPFNATGSAARQARCRPEENLSALAARTENFLSEPESDRRNCGDRHRLIQNGPIQNAGAYFGEGRNYSASSE
jgi:hypothetical protein